VIHIYCYCVFTCNVHD